MYTHRVQSDVFSFELYEQTLQKAIQYRYDFAGITQSEYRTGERLLLLRHDIDTSPLNAWKMACLEHALGVQASYYVLMHSPFYNPAHDQSFDALMDIVQMGFEVGLHYDIRFYERRDLDPIQGVIRDIHALESILGINITSISQHHPFESTIYSDLGRLYVDAYSNSLVNEIKYISDSGFKWREMPLIDIIGKYSVIHALIHPTTWTYGNLDMEHSYRFLHKEVRKNLRFAIETEIAETNRYLRTRKKMDEIRRKQYSDYMTVNS